VTYALGTSPLSPLSRSPARSSTITRYLLSMHAGDCADSPKPIARIGFVLDDRTSVVLDVALYHLCQSGIQRERTRRDCGDGCVLASHQRTYVLLCTPKRLGQQLPK
jgi:hypothetical protein